MGDPWGIGVFREGRRPILSKSSKKNIGEKNPKKRRNRKKFDIFFFTENGLKCIRNLTKHL